MRRVRSPIGKASWQWNKNVYDAIDSSSNSSITPDFRTNSSPGKFGTFWSVGEESDTMFAQMFPCGFKILPRRHLMRAAKRSSICFDANAFATGFWSLRSIR